MTFGDSTSRLCLLSESRLSDVRRAAIQTEAAAEIDEGGGVPDKEAAFKPRCWIGLHSSKLDEVVRAVPEGAVPPLDVKDEGILITFYATMIHKLCGKESGSKTRRPDVVADTARE